MLRKLFVVLFLVFLTREILAEEQSVFSESDQSGITSEAISVIEESFDIATVINTVKDIWISTVDKRPEMQRDIVVKLDAIISVQSKAIESLQRSKLEIENSIDDHYVRKHVIEVYSEFAMAHLAIVAGANPVTMESIALRFERLSYRLMTDFGANAGQLISVAGYMTFACFELARSPDSSIDRREFINALDHVIEKMELDMRKGVTFSGRKVLSLFRLRGTLEQ